MENNIEHIIATLKNRFDIDIYENIKLTERFSARWVICQRCEIKALFIKSDPPPEYNAISLNIPVSFDKSDVSFIYNETDIYYIDYGNYHGLRLTATVKYIFSLFQDLSENYSVYENCSEALTLLYDFCTTVLSIKYQPFPLKDISSLKRVLEIRRLIVPQQKVLTWNFKWTEEVKDHEIVYWNKSSKEGKMIMDFNIQLIPQTYAQSVKLKDVPQLAIKLNANGVYYSDKSFQRWGEDSECIIYIQFVHEKEKDFVFQFDRNKNTLGLTLSKIVSKIKLGLVEIKWTQ